MSQGSVSANLLRQTPCTHRRPQRTQPTILSRANKTVTAITSAIVKMEPSNEMDKVDVGGPMLNALTPHGPSSGYNYSSIRADLTLDTTPQVTLVFVECGLLSL